MTRPGFAVNVVVKGVLYLGVRENTTSHEWQNYAGRMAAVGNIDGDCWAVLPRPERLTAGPVMVKVQIFGRKRNRPAEAGRGSE